MAKVLIKYTTECFIAAQWIWLLGHVIGLDNDVDSVINLCDSNQLLSDVNDS